MKTRTVSAELYECTDPDNVPHVCAAMWKCRDLMAAIANAMSLIARLQNEVSDLRQACRMIGGN